MFIHVHHRENEISDFLGDISSPSKVTNVDLDDDAVSDDEVLAASNGVNGDVSGANGDATMGDAPLAAGDAPPQSDLRVALAAWGKSWWHLTILLIIIDHKP